MVLVILAIATITTVITVLIWLRKNYKSSQFVQHPAVSNGDEQMELQQAQYQLHCFYHISNDKDKQQHKYVCSKAVL